MMSVKIFFCYAHEDEALLNKLKAHLKQLQRQNLIELWHDRNINAGTEWEQEINKHLNDADIILLLVSPDFINSDYCYSIEMQRAFERHESGEAVVIPIILRPVYWQEGVLSKLQALPLNGRPVTEWTSRDKALEDIVIELLKVVKKLIASEKTKQEWIVEGNTLFDLKRYEEALGAYTMAIWHDSNDPIPYVLRADLLHDLQLHKDALKDCEVAIRLGLENAFVYFLKGDSLQSLKRYEEALAAYEYGTNLKPDEARAYSHKGSILRDLKRHEEALAAYEQAIRLNPNNASAYNGMGNVLRDLKRHEEALAAYERAIHLDLNNATHYYNKGMLLIDLERYDEALLLFQDSIRCDPKFVASLVGKAIALHFLGKTNEAEQSYSLALDLEYPFGVPLDKVVQTYKEIKQDFC